MPIYFNYNPGLVALAQPGRGHWTKMDYKDGNVFYKGYYKTHSIEVHARARVYYIYVCLPQTYYKNAAPLMTQYAKKKLLKVINDAFHGIFFPQQGTIQAEINDASIQR